MKSLTRVAGTLLKLTGVFVAFGYVSLTAHLTAIGVPWDAQLGVGTYLAEAYRLVFATAQPVVNVLPALIRLIVVVAVLLALTARWSRAGYALRVAISWISRARQHWITPIVLIVIAMGFYPLMMRDVHFVNTTPYIGTLNGEERFFQPQIFTAMILVCVLIFAMYDSFGRDEFALLNLGARISWRSAAACAGVLLFLAPIIYGTLWHPQDYPSVKVALKGSPDLQCGVMIVKTDTTVVLWQISRGKGSLLVIPEAEIHAFSSGLAHDIRDWVEMAVRGVSPPICKDVPDPPADNQKLAK